MKETILSIAKWHEETFPDETLEGQLQKYNEEKEEFAISDRKDLSELADMFIVACGIARFDMLNGIYALNNVNFWQQIGGFDTLKLCKAIEKKMEKNRKRVWVKSGEGHYHHENGIED